MLLSKTYFLHGTYCSTRQEEKDAVIVRIPDNNVQDHLTIDEIEILMKIEYWAAADLQHMALPL